MKHIIRVIAHWGLLIHIYVSMAGFTLVLLFAITGLTLNHQDFGWGEPQVATSTLKIPEALTEHPDASSIEGHLRQELHLKSPMTDYHEDSDQIEATFAVPGARTVVKIDRAQRMAEVESTTRGMLGKLDDLHKGFDSGRTWYWIIDFAAVLLTISSLTGMITLLSLRARRRSGFVVGLLGVVMVVTIYVVWVPHY